VPRPCLLNFSKLKWRTENKAQVLQVVQFSISCIQLYECKNFKSVRSSSIFHTSLLFSWNQCCAKTLSCWLTSETMPNTSCQNKPKYNTALCNFIIAKSDVWSGQANKINKHLLNDSYYWEITVGHRKTASICTILSCVQVTERKADSEVNLLFYLRKVRNLWFVWENKATFFNSRNYDFSHVYESASFFHALLETFWLCVGME
jgi:hypothetical protein